MKTIPVLLLAALTGTSALAAPKGGELLLQPNPPPSPPPPVSVIQTAPAAPPPPPAAFVYDQKPMGGRLPLVTPEQAQTVIARFKDNYAKAGSPRVLIYVNRELVDENAGLKLSARTEHVEASRSGDATADQQKTSTKNTYRNREARETPLADRQTLRDVERLFGRPLRLGGATLVDQSVATQMSAGTVLEHFKTHTDSTEARRAREAVSKVADVVFEVLISSRQTTVPRVSGDALVSVPDIQATAIRLSDAKVLGQATAADLLQRAGHAGRYHDVREVTEATALSLMEDMTL